MNNVEYKACFKTSREYIIFGDQKAQKKVFERNKTIEYRLKMQVPRFSKL